MLVVESCSWPFLGYGVCGTVCDLRVCVVHRCARQSVGLLTWVGGGLWSAAFPVDAGDEFAVDLAGGGEFLLALCEFFFRLGQGVVELFDSGIGRVGDGGVAEVCEYLAAAELAAAAAEGLGVGSGW